LAAEYSNQSPASTGASWMFTDMLGSVRAITSESRDVVECYDYLPFGRMLSSADNGRSAVGCHPANPDTQLAASATSQKFTGKERDAETGLDFFGARYYSGALGRFTSPDPKANSAKQADPQSLNRYTYVDNNPLKFYDPDGKELRLASGLDAKTKERTINNLVNIYRRPMGRAALEQLAASHMSHIYGTQSLPSALIINKDGTATVEAHFGRTKPYLMTTIDGGKISVDKSMSSVEVNLDHKQIDAMQTLHTKGYLDVPLSEQRAQDHEVGHDLAWDTNPTKTFNQTDLEREEAADTFADELEKEKKDISEETRRRALQLLGIPPP
jgi:RHS repeat-associated protein